jgi:hypothetical protein
MNWNGFGRKSWRSRDIISSFAWKDEGTPQKETSVGIASVLAEIQTEILPNISLSVLLLHQPVRSDQL